MGPSEQENAVTHLVVIRDLATVDAPLDLDGERHDPVDVVDEALEPLGLHVELVLDVGPVHAGLEALDLPADVGLGLEEVALGSELGQGVDLLVGADDRLCARLDHEECLAERACSAARRRVGGYETVD